MNDVTFVRRLERATLGVDGNRWRLAELAAECKADDYPQWAERIGRHKRVRRAARTVRQWAQVAEFRHAIGDHQVPISFYATALRFVDKLPTAQIVEVMGVARDEDVSLEEFTAELRTQAGRPEPPPFDPYKAEDEVKATLGEMLDAPNTPEAKREVWQAALDILLDEVTP